MSIINLLLIAVGLSMDAFAVSICIGLESKKATVQKALTVGLYFGAFQAGMPVIGYLAASLFADKIKAFDHWIAFGLLFLLGGKMIVECFSEKDGDEKRDSTADEKQDGRLTPKKMLPLAIATSIDAMAVGVSLAALEAEIAPAVGFIGATTLILSMIGLKIGNVFGTKLKSKAEFAGGVILILIGTKILFEHILGG